MRTNYCHRFMACNLKILNFFQFFVGISTLIFSGILLNRWQNRIPFIPSPPPQAPKDIQLINSEMGSLEVADQIGTLNLARELVVRSGLNLRIQLYSVELPAPWFLYFLLAVGIILCSASCIGHIAAEAMSGCCLCFDLPYDPTGELERFRCFIQDNADICRWVGITLIAVQAFSLLISLVLRALISTRGKQPNIENGYAASGQPLLTPQQNQSSGLIKGQSTRAGMWITQLRQKYGLNKESSKDLPLNQSEVPDSKS